MDSVKCKIIRAFYIVCAMIPFAMATILAFVCLSGVYERIIPDYTPDYYGLLPMNHKLIGALFLFCLALLCRLIIFCTFTVCNKTIKKCFLSECFCAFIIFVLAWTLRFILIYLFGNAIKPFSDFQNVWNLAHGDLEGGNFTYYTLFPAYLNFSAFERIFLSIFGDRFINLLYFNVLLASCTAILIYCIARVLNIEKQQSMISALIYVFMPANVCYCAIGAPDFLVILFNVTGAILFLYSLKANVPWRKYMFALCGGLSVGIGSAYKTFGVIILIAFIVTLTIKYFARGGGADIVCKRAVTLGLCLILSFCSYKTAITAITCHTEFLFGVELDFSTSVPHFLLVGLNSEGEGQIHLGSLSRSYYKEYMNNGHDAKAAAEVAYNLLLDDWSRNAKKLPSMFAKKMIRVWQDDCIPLKYVISEERMEIAEKQGGFAAQIYALAVHLAGSIGELFYLFLMLSAMIGCLSFTVPHIRKNITQESSNLKRETELPHYELVFLLLIIFGYFCMTFLAEGQSRYKNLIMPFVCIVSGYGIRTLLNLSINFPCLKQQHHK